MEKDLLEAHRILMASLIDEADMYRRGWVGVIRLRAFHYLHVGDDPGCLIHFHPQVSEMLALVQGEMGRESLQAALSLSDRKSFRERYLKPVLADGLVELTIADKPKSRLQKYCLTDKGRQWLLKAHHMLVDVLGDEARWEKFAGKIKKDNLRRLAFQQEFARVVAGWRELNG